MIFDPLLSVDDKGNPVPILATEVPTAANGGISPDGLTVTYHLRPGVKFTDGVPLTSKDVKFTWRAMMNPANNVVSRNGFDDVTSIDTPDDTTVIVHLKRVYAPFTAEFFGEGDAPTEIAPEHLLAKFPNLNQVPFNSEPVGSGPYKLAEWVKGDHITLVANPNYFRGTPGLKRIVIRIIPDENTALNLLRTHEIDWMFEPSFATFAALKRIKDVNVLLQNINGYEGMAFNTAHPPLDDVQVRRALAYAVNKKQLLTTLTFGQETMATEDIPDWYWAYNPHVTVYPFDPAKAKALLAADGWRPGPDGVLAKHGQPLSLLLATNQSNATRREAALQIQAMLRTIGVETQIKFFDGGTYFAPAPLGILQGGKFDMALYGWYAGADPDNSGLFTCANRPPAGFNYTRYCAPAMEAAQRAALTHYDLPTRKKAYAQIEEALATDAPQIFFFWRRQAQATNPDFKGFDPNPVTESWNSYQWSI